MTAGLLEQTGVSLVTSYAIGTGLLGAGVGFVQQRVLQRHFAHAIWWALASTLGGVGIGPALTLVARIAFAGVGSAGAHAMAAMIVGSFGGAIYGAITGLVLAWTLTQPRAANVPAGR